MTYLHGRTRCPGTCVALPTLAASLLLLACSADQAALGTAADAGGTPESSTPARSNEDIVGDFLAAWNETDVPKRMALLEKCFTPDGAYTDSGGAASRAADRSSLSTVIDQYQSLFPAGTVMSLDSGVDSHHDQLRYKWKIVLPDTSAAVQTGEDQGELSAERLLLRITGFFDMVAPSTPTSTVAAFLQAFDEASASSRTDLLTTATADSVVWKDRDESATGRSALEARLTEWTRALSITALTVDAFHQHDDVFRARFHAKNDTATVGELFGHTGSDGSIDWATVFDGELK